jgi:hypothetical protein
MDEERHGQGTKENNDKLSQEEDKSAGEEDGAGDPTMNRKEEESDQSEAGEDLQGGRAARQGERTDAAVRGNAIG